MTLAISPAPLLLSSCPWHRSHAKPCGIWACPISTPQYPCSANPGVPSAHGRQQLQLRRFVPLCVGPAIFLPIRAVPDGYVRPTRNATCPTRDHIILSATPGDARKCLDGCPRSSQPFIFPVGNRIIYGDHVQRLVVRLRWLSPA